VKTYIVFGALGIVSASALAHVCLILRRKRGRRPVRFVSLCFTDQTLYGVDVKGRVWFIDMCDGKWALHGNPTESEAKE
jgi:hypothetical protein